MTRTETELRRVQEQLWVLAARRGDDDAFGRLVDAYDRRLLYFVRRFERDVDKASDIVQEVWLTVFRKIGKLTSAESFRTWLYRIAHAKAVTSIRREMRAGQVGRSLEATAPKPRTNQHEALDNAELVHLALERVSVEHREVLTLRFLESMTLDEIAEVLARPVGTIKSRMHYAKQNFRQAVEELENG
jgi:RNA polymerase sigma-70 factor, ECF subfamily